MRFKAVLLADLPRLSFGRAAHPVRFGSFFAVTVRWSDASLQMSQVRVVKVVRSVKALARLCEAQFFAVQNIEMDTQKKSRKNEQNRLSWLTGQV